MAALSKRNLSNDSETSIWCALMIPELDKPLYWLSFAHSVILSSQISLFNELKREFCRLSKLSLMAEVVYHTIKAGVITAMSSESHYKLIYRTGLLQITRMNKNKPNMIYIFPSTHV